MALDDPTSNFRPNREFTRFTKLLIELTGTLFFRTSNKLKHVHLLVIEFKFPIFGFERSKTELRTLFDPSLLFSRIFSDLPCKAQLWMDFSLIP